MRGPPDHRTAVIIAVFFTLQFFFALQFFLRCSFFCVAVFFALQLFCNQVLSRDGGTPSLMIKEKDEDWGGLGEVRVG